MLQGDMYGLKNKHISATFDKEGRMVKLKLSGAAGRYNDFLHLTNFVKPFDEKQLTKTITCFHGCVSLIRRNVKVFLQCLHFHSDRLYILAIFHNQTALGFCRTQQNLLFPDEM